MTLYQFDIRLSDDPLFYERSYNFFVREKAENREEFIENSDTTDQRTRQQCSQRQIIDTSKGVDISSIDRFRQSGKSSEAFGIWSSIGVSRKGVFGNDLFGEVEDTKVAESGSRLGTPGYGDEVSLIVVFRSNQRMSIKQKVLELTERGNPIRSQWLKCCTVGFMMINSLGVRNLDCFRWMLSRKWREELYRVFRTLQGFCWRTDG